MNPLEFHPVTVPLDELAWRIAVWKKLVPVGWKGEISHELKRERHGIMPSTGRPIVHCWFTVKANGKQITLTKTQLREYFRYAGIIDDSNHSSVSCAYIDELDSDGAHFREAASEMNCWKFDWLNEKMLAMHEQKV